MAKVLFLFVKTDEQESKKLRDYLQTQLGTRANLNTVKDALADDSSFRNELTLSRCIVLISSKQSSEFFKQGTAEKEGDYVLFDGRCIQEHLRDGSLQKKLVVVQFGQAVSTSYVPDGYDTEKVYLLDENFNSTDAVLNQIEDAVKGILTMKVKEDKMEKKKSCLLL